MALTLHLDRRFRSLLISAGLLLLVVVGAGVFGIGHSVQADVASSLSGYAWSDNIGWISFNCKDGGPGKSNICSTKNYGVHVDEFGTLSGYAWSDNIGWISFNKNDLNGTNGSDACPTGVCDAKLSGGLIGWARACAGTVNGDCTGTTRSDGWDGWISLDCETANQCIGHTYDVTLSSGSLHGFAWGSDVVGWISFNCAEGGVGGTNLCGGNVDYAVIVETPATVLSLSLIPSSNNVDNTTPITLTWTDAPLGSVHYQSCVASSNPSVWSGNKITPQNLDSGLTAHYPLDETSGIVAHDTSGNGHDGTLMTTSGVLPTWISGKIGGGLQFSRNGANSTGTYVDLGDTNNFGFPLTLSIWMNAPGGSGLLSTDYGLPNDAPPSGGNPHPYNGAMIAIGGGGINAWYGNNACGCPGGRWSWYADGAYPIATWALVTIVYPSSQQTKIYVNGVEKAGYYNGGSAGSIQTSPLNHGSIGLIYPAYYYDGKADDLRVYNRALSAPEIATLYATNGAAPSETVGPLPIVGGVPTTYDFSITCTDANGFSKSANTSVTVHGPDYYISADDIPLNFIGPGSGSAYTTIHLIPQYGYAGVTSLSVDTAASGLPAGVTFTPTSPISDTSPYTPIQLTVHAPTPFQGDYPITINASGGGINHFTTLTIHAKKVNTGFQAF